MKRLCICVLYEKDGIVRDYVTYYLKGLQEVAERVIAVVNGTLNTEGRRKLDALGVEIIVRENKGLDFGAWKYTINELGYDELAKYDELILTNTTCYGPFYPISEMFTEMELRGCDFWGVTKHPYCNINLIKNDEHTKLLEHIQSYFLVFNNNVVSSNTFKKWWKNVKFYNDYWEIIGYCETKLTKYFENAGFISDSYIKISETSEKIDNPMFLSKSLLQINRMPLIKRKSIINLYEDMIFNSLTYQANELINFIKYNTNYDINLIYDDIIHSYPMSLIKQNLHLNYILSSEHSGYKPDGKRIALILHIYYEDLVEYCFKYARSMPDGTDIYIVSSKQQTLDFCKQKAPILEGKNLIYRLKENRGRDVAAYLVTCADVFEKYDLVCCMHDKKSPHVKQVVGREFSYQCFECNLKSREYVENIINTFDKYSHLGILSQPILLFGPFITLPTHVLGRNETIMKELYKMLELKIPFDRAPVTPFGSMFWIRGNAIKPLFRHKWVYEDFPDEPLPPDGTISHAIERIYPFVVQEAGYMAGWIMPEDFASLYIDNLYHQTSRSVSVSIPLNYHNKFIENIFSVKNSSDKRHKVVTILGVKLKFKRK